MTNRRSGNPPLLKGEAAESGASHTVKPRPKGEVCSKVGVNVSAGAAGAGSATLLVLMAQNLPESNPVRSWLILGAPTISICVSTVWFWVRRTLESRARQKETQQLFARLQETFLREMAAPNISPEQSEYLKRNLEELQKLEMAVMYERIQVLLDSE